MKLRISDRYLKIYKVKQRPPKKGNFPNDVSYPFREWEESEKLGAAKIFRWRGRVWGTLDYSGHCMLAKPQAT